MAELNDKLTTLRGVGPQRARTLEKLGLETLGDLLRFFPRAYEDRRERRTIDSLVPNETVCVEAMVAAEPRLTHVRRGMDLVKLRIVDETGALDVTFFNQSYVKNQLLCGESYVFYGKVGGSLTRKTLTNPDFEKVGTGKVAGRILPVYRLTRGISGRQMLSMVEETLERVGEIIPETLPREVLAEHELCAASYALRNVHLPTDFTALDTARRRLVFEELFLFSCAMESVRDRREKGEGAAFSEGDVEEFYRTLPFAPTAAQRRAVADAVADMRSGRAMSRLVQGDVGSGKTMVAAACLYLAWKNGYQGAFMAPTEILAGQHLHTMERFLSPLGLRVGLLSGSMKAKERREVRRQLADGALDVVVGTHALISEDVAYARLGLVITDEQHRFGVNQRARLRGKGENVHMMVMSATPIPRTLALILYGDLDVSIIDELPPGRQEVRTFALGESYRTRLNGFIRQQVQEGRQVFVVCPMVEENEELLPALRSATEHARAMQETFPELRVGCVHGRMKSGEKDEVMAAFVAGEIDILVSTTVVEVGVDVPNASVMIVENAERFGLSQLHQLRGRVGRGSHRSWCFLMSEAEGEEARQRLKVLCRTNDGFAVAEEDLRLRGPGDFFGEKQHGELGELHVADLGADMDVLQEARDAAVKLMSADPLLQQPGHRPLREYLHTLFERKADTWN